jgi:mannitol 2-dehydrogenase
MTPIKLRRASLHDLPSQVEIPSYDPARVRPAIVHLGFGNFHRAHMARYTHDLMALDGAALEWGIVGAGLLESDQRVVDALAPQDWLYALVERDAHGESVKIIGSVVGVIPAAADPEALLAAIDRAQTRIVSLTVTEHGYCLNRATKRLDLDHPAIRADLADKRRPGSAIGVIVEAYRRRMADGGRAFTAMSCDNIQHNGQVLARAVLDFAQAVDPALADWIEEHGRFPCTMVDRITPVTQADDVADLARRHGVEDAWPVFSETFSQWVIEDDFADGRPDWVRVGAQFVDDVSPYEFMKLRLLNASHLAIAGPGRLMGYTYIDETLRDPDIAAYMTALMDRETGPTLLPTPGVDIAAYKRRLIDRFANPNIRDTVERVNTDAALNYLLDPIRDRLARGQSIDLLAFAVAAWLRRMRGEDERGAPIDIRHPLAGLLRERAMEGGADPGPMLRIGELFGDLAEDKVFSVAVGKWFGSIHSEGVKPTLSAVVRS